MLDRDNKVIGAAIAKKNQIRFDLEIIASLIDANSKVLDIGCGNGDLLKYLKDKKTVDARGLELSSIYVSESVRKGISVIQGNAEDDLVYYHDNSFDYAILSQTIQAMHDPREVMEQMLRIAQFAIISLPNFAYIKNRLYLTFKGEMPVSKTIPYQWYDTPNIHFCSIKDFEKLCTQMGFDIKKRIYLTNKRLLSGRFTTRIWSNCFAEYGIFLITKSKFAGISEGQFVFDKESPLLTAPKINTGLASSGR